MGIRSLKKQLKSCLDTVDICIYNSKLYISLVISFIICIEGDCNG